MNDFWYQLFSLDFPALATATFACLSCALLGNFLLLRRLSLMGDAISHAVLPGIVLAFLFTGSRGGLVVFIGAAIAGVVTSILVEAVKKLGRVESSAAMGVVFSILFALGVLLIEQASARQIDLDADCLLHGQLETIFWYPPREFSNILTLHTISLLPSQLTSALLVLVICAAFVVIGKKELTIASFDPALSTSLGYNANLIHYLLMIIVAAAVVSSFSAVGSILVISMLICPAACARLFTDRLNTQLWLSLLFALVSCITGYIAAAFLPIWLGFHSSLNAAGMISTVLGLLLTSAILFSPHYGVIGKVIRTYKMKLKIFHEDLLGLLYRLEEIGIFKIHTTKILTPLVPQLAENLEEAEILSHIALWKSKVSKIPLFNAPLLKYAFASIIRKSVENNEIIEIAGELELTKVGRERARNLIRTHRLWESYLVSRAGLKPDHVHDTATTLEHFTPEELARRVAERTQFPDTDPHGKKIP